MGEAADPAPATSPNQGKASWHEDVTRCTCDAVIHLALAESIELEGT